MATGFDSTQTRIKPKARILLAEDIPLNQMVLQAQLEEYDYEVQIVNNGQEVIDALLLGKYDLVLMDLQMPVMGGLDATEKIRTELNISNNDLPIIGITAYNLPDELKHCLESGFDDCLTKPISSENLNAAIEAWLNLGDYDPLTQISTNDARNDNNSYESVIDRKQLEQLILYIGSQKTQSFCREFAIDTESRLKDLMTNGIPSVDDLHAISGACGNLGMIRLKSLCDDLMDTYSSLSREQSIESLNKIMSELDKSTDALEKLMFKSQL